LAAEFEMDLGLLKYFWRLRWQGQDKRLVKICIRLFNCNLYACKPAKTPIGMNHKLGIFPNQVLTDKYHYQLLIQRLIYLCHTQPDIVYAAML